MGGGEEKEKIMVIDELRSKQVQFHKAGDMERLGVLRYFLSEVKNKEIALRPEGVELTDKHVWKTLKRLMKQRNEGIEFAQKAGRDDLVEKEK
ncbi:GatB/YqeY domain-containing protein, partial [bacterium]|nr:GatB/YqeY domain-containing protein [bacterium]